MRKHEIIRLEFNKVAFELFEKLLEDDKNFSPLQFFEIVGQKGVGKTSLLNTFHSEAKKKNRETLFINSLDDGLENFNPGNNQYNYIILDNVLYWDQIVSVSKRFPSANIIFSCKSNDELEYNSLVLRANICNPSIDEYSQIIRSMFFNSGINLKDSTCNILAYLTEKSDKGLHAINDVLKKSAIDDIDEDVLSEFEKQIKYLGANRARNHFSN